MSATNERIRVGFLGAGRMATALAKGLVAAGFTAADSILASDPLAVGRDSFAKASGCRSTASNLEVVRGADVLVLAVKPGHVAEVLAEISSDVQSRHLLISIAAGVPLRTFAAALGSQARLVRVMPNTPCLVGAGASAYALGGGATADDGKLVSRLLSTVGIAVELPEQMLDAVTGLSGSGPAYVYQVIEALSDGGVLMGLPRTSPRLGQPDRARRGPNGDPDRRSAGRAEGRGRQPRRHDDRRLARPGNSGPPRGIDERRASGDSSLARVGGVGLRRARRPG